LRLFYKKDIYYKIVCYVQQWWQWQNNDSIMVIQQSALHLKKTKLT
jgi:hypothetical protein